MYDYAAAIADWPELTPKAKQRLAELLRPGLTPRREQKPPLDARVHRLVTDMARGGDGKEPDPDINDRPHPNPPVPLRPIPPIKPPEPKP